MATQTKKQKSAETVDKGEFVSSYKSNLVLSGKVKTDIYTTTPKTVFTIEGSLSDSANIELLKAIDAVLAKHRL